MVALSIASKRRSQSTGKLFCFASWYWYFGKSSGSCSPAPHPSSPRMGLVKDTKWGRSRAKAEGVKTPLEIRMKKADRRRRLSMAGFEIAKGCFQKFFPFKRVNGTKMKKGGRDGRNPTRKR